MLQMSIEGIEALERWNGHQEVPADIADQTFYFALIVPFAWTAEPDAPIEVKSWLELFGPRSVGQRRLRELRSV